MSVGLSSFQSESTPHSVKGVIRNRRPRRWDLTGSQMGDMPSMRPSLPCVFTFAKFVDADSIQREVTRKRVRHRDVAKRFTAQGEGNRNGWISPEPLFHLT